MYMKNINDQALEVIWRTDGYKTDHRRQYPENTTKVYANFTPRSIHSSINGNRYPAVVMFGLKRLLEDLKADFDVFFAADIDVVAQAYKKRLEAFTGLENLNVDHLYQLHDLGYLPLEIKAVPEGSIGLINQPLLTIMNTHPCAYWLVNYLETWISTALWQPITSATTAWNIRQLMDTWAVETGCDPEENGPLAHDFSYRGMAGIEAASASGAGHLISFIGSDSLSAWDYIMSTYPKTEGVIQIGVPATEHAVMTAGANVRENGTMDEREQVQRLLDLYPQGFVSVVSDSYDYWDMITTVLPEFKEQIMKRDGRYVVRPDSGNPVDIVTGDPNAEPGSAEHKGTLEVLWEIFGGTINEKGYKVLDPHIGVIYGDSMNYNTINEMCSRMESKGFATCNIVFGLGSYNYQYVTRDSYGFAMKTTWVEVDGKPKSVFKDPKTAQNVKRSARGLLTLTEKKGQRVFKQDVHASVEAREKYNDVFNLVFKNGVIMNMEDDFQKIRKNLQYASQRAKDNEWF